jgi:hypothetical protein
MVGRRESGKAGRREKGDGNSVSLVIFFAEPPSRRAAEPRPVHLLLLTTGE